MQLYGWLKYTVCEELLVEVLSQWLVPAIALLFLACYRSAESFCRTPHSILLPLLADAYADVHSLNEFLILVRVENENIRHKALSGGELLLQYHGSV